MIGFDTETRGLDWFDPEHQAFLATWADARSEYHIPLLDSKDRKRFNDIMKKEKALVAHNTKFDVHQVRATTGYDALSNGHELHDTDIMSRVLYPEGQRKGSRGGHGLKNLAQVYLRADAADAEDAIKEMGKSIGLKTLKKTGAYYDVWRAYPEVMEEYARLDARYTYDLFHRFAAEMAQNDKAREVYELEMRVLPILIQAEAIGVQVDQAAVQSLLGEWQPVHDELYEWLCKQLGEESLTGEGSQDKLREALLDAGVPLHRKTDGGILSTDKYALQEFEDEFEVVAKLTEWRTAKRFLDTYIGPMVDRDVVHASFQQAEAWTGRMSCRRPNMQNIPKRTGKEVRAMFVPREGYSFVVCDYEGIESRLLAYYLGDDEYRQLFREGRDPHAWMAAQIHGGDPEDYGKETPNRALRDKAKHTTFAITYGAGAPRVSDMNKISRDEAKALISKLKASLPGWHKLNRRIRNKVENLGYVNTIYGRKNPVNKDKAYVGLNALIQGSAADIMKRGLVNVDEAVSDLGGRPLLVVHDEVVIEVPTENAQEALRRTEAAMVEAYDLDPQLAVEGSVVHTSYADA